MGQEEEILPEREGKSKGGVIFAHRYFYFAHQFFSKHKGFFEPPAALPNAADVATTHQSELVTVWSMTVPGGGDVNCSVVTA